MKITFETVFERNSIRPDDVRDEASACFNGVHEFRVDGKRGDAEEVARVIYESGDPYFDVEFLEGTLSFNSLIDSGYSLFVYRGQVKFSTPDPVRNACQVFPASGRRGSQMRNTLTGKTQAIPLNSPPTTEALTAFRKSRTVSPFLLNR